jgi:hypothetical protein
MADGHRFYGLMTNILFTRKAMEKTVMTKNCLNIRVYITLEWTGSYGVMLLVMFRRTVCLLGHVAFSVRLV